MSWGGNGAHLGRLEAAIIEWISLSGCLRFHIFLRGRGCYRRVTLLEERLQVDVIGGGMSSVLPSLEVFALHSIEASHHML